MKEDTKKSTNVIKGPWTLTETMKKRAANASTDWAKKRENGSRLCVWRGINRSNMC